MDIICYWKACCQKGKDIKKKKPTMEVETRRDKETMNINQQTNTDNKDVQVSEALIDSVVPPQKEVKKAGR
jgi:hypothetical protein